MSDSIATNAFSFFWVGAIHCICETHMHQENHKGKSLVHPVSCGSWVSDHLAADTDSLWSFPARTDHAGVYHYITDCLLVD